MNKVNCFFRFLFVTLSQRHIFFELHFKYNRKVAHNVSLRADTELHNTRARTKLGWVS